MKLSNIPPKLNSCAKFKERIDAIIVFKPGHKNKKVLLSKEEYGYKNTSLKPFAISKSKKFTGYDYISFEDLKKYLPDKKYRSRLLVGVYTTPAEYAQIFKICGADLLRINARLKVMIKNYSNNSKTPVKLNKNWLAVGISHVDTPLEKTLDILVKDLGPYERDIRKIYVKTTMGKPIKIYG